MRWSIAYLPFASSLQFLPLPGPLLATLVTITVIYGVTSEIAKRLRYRS